MFMVLFYYLFTIFVPNKTQREMKKHALALLTVLCLSLAGRAMNAVDSLLHDFEKHPTAQTANHFLDVLYVGGLLTEPIQLRDKLPADSLRQQLWYWAGEYCYAIQDYERAISYAKRALPLIPKGTDTRADCLNLLSICHIRISDYEQAAHYAKQCHELDLKSGDADRISSSLNTLAAIYLGANQPKEAEKYVLRGIELAEKGDNTKRMAVLQGMASEIYHAMGKDKEALKYVQRAYELDSMDGREEQARVRLAEKASVLIGLHRYEEAEQVLKDIIPALRESDNQHSLGIALNKMGMALLCQKRENEALPYYREAADIFSQMGDIYNEVHARRGLYESLWQTQPDSARAELQRFNDLKDSIYSTTSAESLARYNAQFGNDWLQLENHAQRRAYLWALAGIALVGLIAFLAIVMNRRSQLRNFQLNEKLQAVVAELNKERQEKLRKEREKEEANKDSFLDQVTSTIEQLITQGQADVKHLASALGLSPFRLRQQLSTVTDEQPKDMIRRLRIERAQHLLAERRDLTVQEVAYLCGYGDTANFSRAFKQLTGLTPSDYQATAR